MVKALEARVAAQDPNRPPTEKARLQRELEKSRSVLKQVRC